METKKKIRKVNLSLSIDYSAVPAVRSAVEPEPEAKPKSVDFWSAAEVKNSAKNEAPKTVKQLFDFEASKPCLNFFELESLEERAAIMEFDGKMERKEAEQKSIEAVLLNRYRSYGIFTRQFVDVFTGAIEDINGARISSLAIKRNNMYAN